MSYLGLDIGTSGSKAVVFSENGIELALAYREYSLISENPGWVELDSLVVINHCFDIIREVSTKVAKDPIEALCISSQGEAFLLF